MKIGSSLALIGIGAILAFAVTANTSALNLHTAGWVLMIIGVIGLLLPGRTAGWLGRRFTVRRSFPARRIRRVTVPSYVASDPGAASLHRGLPTRPTLLEEDGDLVEGPADYDVIEETRPAAPAPREHVTEVIEDIYEEP
jgi:hypothetical protein